MNGLVQRVLTCLILVGLYSVECIEVFKERAWMDERGQDKYFEYSDLTESALPFDSNYSNNIDFQQFEVKEISTKNLKRQSTKRTYSKKNQSTHSSLNVIDLFLNTIKKVVSPPTQTSNRHHHNVNETSKGIDIRFDNRVHSLPAFGNNQDMKFIFLGTKWCGSGDVAKDQRDIGYFYLTDSCCREHDLCDKIIEPSSENYGLRNSGKFTRLHCECDERFYACLKRVNTLVSKQIGIFYFNVLSHQCFREDYPVIACAASVKGRCVRFIKNLNESKIFQWFDNKWF